MDSHGNSISFNVPNRPQFGPTPQKIPWAFLVIYPGFYLLSMLETWHGFWTSSSHGISTAFAKTMMGFPSNLVSFSNQTKLPSKRHEKIPVTFFTGGILYCWLLLHSKSGFTGQISHLWERLWWWRRELQIQRWNKTLRVLSFPFSNSNSGFSCSPCKSNESNVAQNPVLFLIY